MLSELVLLQIMLQDIPLDISKAVLWVWLLDFPPDSPEGAFLAGKCGPLIRNFLAQSLNPAKIELLFVLLLSSYKHC